MKNSVKFLIAALILFLLILLSLILGEFTISPIQSIQAFFGIGSKAEVSIVQDVRLPRALVGGFVGATLAISGIFMRYALQNPLSDSGILGVQSGAVVITLIILLYFPALYLWAPLLSFFGGLLAFVIVLIFTVKSKRQTTTLILAGVAVNAFFAAIIGILTILNPLKLQSALTYLNGSLTGISPNEAFVICTLACILLVGAFILIPLLKILNLDDQTIFNLGRNPRRYRIIAAFYSILLASITASFIGVIAFIGIIIPAMSRRIFKGNIKTEIIGSILLGSIIVIFADLSQKVIFAPLEIPVGIIIGLFSAPLFLIILRRESER